MRNLIKSSLVLVLLQAISSMDTFAQCEHCCPEFQQKAENLESANRGLNNRISSIITENEGLSSKVIGLEDELIKLRDDLIKCQNSTDCCPEQSELLQKVNDLEQQVTSLKQQLNDSIHELQICNGENNELESQNTLLENQISGMKQIIDAQNLFRKQIILDYILSAQKEIKVTYRRPQKTLNPDGFISYTGGMSSGVLTFLCSLDEVEAIEVVFRFAMLEDQRNEIINLDLKVEESFSRSITLRKDVNKTNTMQSMITFYQGKMALNSEEIAAIFIGNRQEYNYSVKIEGQNEITGIIVFRGK